MTGHSKLILGCGYVGQRVAQQWLDAGHRVMAITRSESSAAALQENGLVPIVWNWHDPHPPHGGNLDLEDVDTVLIAVSHAVPEGNDPQSSHRLGLMHALQWLGRRPGRRWIYLSTTGVYGSVSAGALVDETTPIAPDRPSSISAASAEAWLQENLPESERVVLRPAGIYGPNRVPNATAIRESLPIAAAPDSILNLIHVDDLASIIVRISNSAPERSLYCVCDGHSPTRRDYYAFIASLKGWPPPRFVDDGAHSQLQQPSGSIAPQRPRARSDGNKRVDPRRLLADVPYSFRYPSYREGLTALAQEIA
ncbi:MAG: NAD-dependent epimerase/dehydratase family protein [Pirellula sp.]